MSRDDLKEKAKEDLQKKTEYTKTTKPLIEDVLKAMKESSEAIEAITEKKEVDAKADFATLKASIENIQKAAKGFSEGGNISDKDKKSMESLLGGLGKDLKNQKFNLDKTDPTKDDVQKLKNFLSNFLKGKKSKVVKLSQDFVLTEDEAEKFEGAKKAGNLSYFIKLSQTHPIEYQNEKAYHKNFDKDLNEAFRENFEKILGEKEKQTRDKDKIADFIEKYMGEELIQAYNKSNKKGTTEPDKKAQPEQAQETGTDKGAQPAQSGQSGQPAQTQTKTQPETQTEQPETEQPETDKNGKSPDKETIEKFAKLVMELKDKDSFFQKIADLFNRITSALHITDRQFKLTSKEKLYSHAVEASGGIRSSNVKNYKKEGVAKPEPGKSR